MDAKTLSRLEEFESSKQYYDALQFCRTKLTRSFRLKNAEEQAIPLVLHALDFFLKENQNQCAIDIATLLAESLLKNSTPITDGFIGVLGQIASKLENIHEKDEKTDNLVSASRRQFVDTCIQWTQPQCSDESEKKYGAAQLHYSFANHYLAANFVEKARNHFLLANRPQEFANFLYTIWESKGVASECDLILAQAVLQLLCIDRYPTACQLFTAYSSKAADPKTPLMNFTKVLLDVINSGDIAQYSTIVEVYMPEIMRDENFKGYLSKIGKMYFGIRENNSNGAGGLAGIISGLFGGAEQQEDAATSHLSGQRRADSASAAPAHLKLPPKLAALKRPVAKPQQQQQQQQESTKMEVDDLD